MKTSRQQEKGSKEILRKCYFRYKRTLGSRKGGYLRRLVCFLWYVGAGCTGMKTAAATVVVQSPSLSPVADCVTFLVWIIMPLALKSCSFSRQALSGSNWMPIVVASIEAARSSA